MAQGKTLIILFIALVVLFAASAVAYNRMSAGRNAQLLVPPADASNNAQAVDPSPDYIAESEDSEDISEAVLPAIDFAFFNADDQPLQLSDFYGKPIVLNFWASWCPPCKREMPEFNRVYLEMEDDVVFLMIDLVDGTREKKQNGADYALQEGFNFPIYFDLEQQGAIAYQVMSIPTTYFIDAEGNIATYAKGAIDEDTLRLGIAMASGAEK